MLHQCMGMDSELVSMQYKSMALEGPLIISAGLVDFHTEVLNPKFFQCTELKAWPFLFEPEAEARTKLLVE